MKNYQIAVAAGLMLLAGGVALGQQYVHNGIIWVVQEHWINGQRTSLLQPSSAEACISDGMYYRTSSSGGGCNSPGSFVCQDTSLVTASSLPINIGSSGECFFSNGSTFLYSGLNNIYTCPDVYVDTQEFDARCAGNDCLGVQQQHYRISSSAIANYPYIGLIVPQLRTIVRIQIFSEILGCGNNSSPAGASLNTFAIITFREPEPKRLWYKMVNGVTTRSPEFVPDTSPGFGGWLKYEQVKSYPGSPATGYPSLRTRIIVNSLDGLTVIGSPGCADLRAFQSYINTGSPALAPEIIARLDIECPSETNPAIDCRDLFAFAEITRVILDTNCNTGDVNNSGVTNWCDAHAVGGLINPNDPYNPQFGTPVLLCSATYDIIADTDLDEDVDVNDFYAIRRPLQRIVGDANQDGLVNFLDITAVQANFGTFGAAWSSTDGNIGHPGDADGDGVVTFLDITTVLSVFNNPPTCP